MRPGPAGPWLPLLAWLAIPYALTTLAIQVVGISVVVPWRFVLLLAVFVMPAAFCLARLLAARPCRHPGGAAAYVVLGLLLVSTAPQVARHPLVVLLLAAWLARPGGGLPAGFPRTVGASLAVVVLGYGAVWNLNYLIAPAPPALLHDPALLHIDLAVHGWLRSVPVEARGLFPLVTSPLPFALLENAYEMLFVELFVVIFALAERPADLVRFLRAVFLCYFVGLLVFFVYPVVGPCIAAPETFAPAYEGTRTHALMQSMASEFAAVGRKTGVNGFAYFVALPSLHVALAVLFQTALRGSRAQFWTFLPINVLLAASTVLLGYHYLLDVPAGIAVALLARRAVRAAPHRGPALCMQDAATDPPEEFQRHPIARAG